MSYAGLKSSLIETAWNFLQLFSVYAKAALYVLTTCLKGS